MLLERRRGMPEEQWRAKSRQIFEKVLQSGAFQNAKSVLIYVSFEREVDTHALIKAALERGKTVCVPYIDVRDAMDACQIDSMDALLPGKYGILEPREKQPYPPGKIELVFVPGVGFDRRGARLGFGKGYYDRFLSGTGAYKLGLCFETQLVDEVSIQAHDIRMDAVLTECATYPCTLEGFDRSNESNEGKGRCFDGEEKAEIFTEKEKRQA